jgi:hypothetical protein
MDVPRKLKLFFTGMIAVAPFVAGAQTTSGASLQVDSGASLLIFDGTTAPLLNDTGLTLAPGQIFLSAPGTTGIFAQSIGGGGGDDFAGLLSLGTLPTAGLFLNLGTFTDPTLSIGPTNNYSFGVTPQPTTNSPTLTLNQLHGIVANGSPVGAVNAGNFANSAPGSQGFSAPGISVVPEPGVTALLILGGLGFAGRLLRKRI